MGDRTSVELTVRLADKQKVEALVVDEFGVDDLGDEGCGYAWWSFHDCNYAELGFESRLQELSIPYDKQWDAGYGYPAGEEVFRIKADGEPELKEFSQGMRGMVSLDEAKTAYADGTLDAFFKTATDDAGHISWEDQEIILTNLKAKKG